MSTPPDQNDEMEASTPPETPGQASPSAPADRAAPAIAGSDRRPWHASTWLIIAYSAFLMVIFCIIGLIPYIDTIKNMFLRPGLGSVPAETPLAVASTTSAAPVGATQPACVIIWMEHQPDDLGKKSRATVWEQKVSDPVKAAGMTPQEFYDLVVEHNPQLVQDDYEFKKGKTYFLPECQ